MNEKDLEKKKKELEQKLKERASENFPKKSRDNVFRKKLPPYDKTERQS